jgi:hypothetical protein
MLSNEVLIIFTQYDGLLFGLGQLLTSIAPKYCLIKKWGPL